MNNLIDALENFSEKTGRAIAWLTLLMVVITFLVVVLRYVFDTGWIALQESVTYLHAMVFLLGAAYTMKQEAHVRVDIFYRKMNPTRQAWVDLLGGLLLLLPVCLFIFIASWEYVVSSWSLLEGSPEAGGLPLVFLLKSCILLMSGLVLLQGLAHSLRAFARLKVPHD
ncbi:MAG: TRAP transporter small permease subunit [Gammaproteobacteria bacterium]|nr:TRAP transporter small permease subunit [Gammaproteobacteria bacterium]